MDLGIKGRVALVTGAGRGIGRQICLTLAEEGAKVAVNDLFQERADEVAQEISKAGGQAMGVQADVTEEEGCRRFYEEAVAALGPADILVNNVGGSRGGRDFDSATDQDWLDTVTLNLFSTIRMTRLALPAMKERRWGRIVNIASIFGREHGGGVSYMTCKAAVIALSKHLALSLAPLNVLVNTVSPGSIKFPGGSWERFVDSNPPEVVQEFIARNLPMGRFGWPEPVGALVAFMCSERADLLTGASVNIDGGQSRSLI